MVERRKFVSGGALDQVRRLEDLVCSKRFSRMVLGGREHRVGYVECHIVHNLSRNEIKTRESDWVKFPRRWQI